MIFICISHKDNSAF